MFFDHIRIGKERYPGIGEIDKIEKDGELLPFKLDYSVGDNMAS